MERTRAAQDHSADSVNKHRAENTFAQGDLIALEIPASSATGKLSRSWTGPYRVHSATGPTTVNIGHLHNTSDVQTVTSRRLKLITHPSRTRSRNSPRASSWSTRLSTRNKSLTTTLLSPNTAFAGLATLPVMTHGSHPLVYLSTLSPLGTAHPASPPSLRQRRSLSRTSTKRSLWLCRRPHRHRLLLIPAVYAKLLSAQTSITNTDAQRFFSWNIGE